MAANIEIEAKALITEKEYLKIIKHFEDETSKEFDQTNHYIDTKDFALKQLGIGLRIRNVASNYTLTLKAPMAEGLLEKDQNISRESFQKLRKGIAFPDGIIKEFVKMIGIDSSKLQILAKLTTHRIEIEDEDSMKKLAIDKNVYNEITDYEVELEANTLDQAKIELQKLFKDLGISYKDNPKSKQSRAMESIQNSLN